MPELPDVVVYIEALAERVEGRRLDALLLRSPFVLRSVEPPIEMIQGLAIRGLRRVGKRIAFAFDHPAAPDACLYLVLHLMIAGRLRWREPGQKAGVAPKLILAVFEFGHGTLL